MSCSVTSLKRHRSSYDNRDNNHHCANERIVLKRRRFLPSTLSSAVPPTKKHQIEPSPFTLTTFNLKQDDITARIRYHLKRYSRSRRNQASTPSSSTHSLSEANSSATPSNISHSFLNINSFKQKNIQHYDNINQYASTKCEASKSQIGSPINIFLNSAVVSNGCGAAAGAKFLDGSPVLTLKQMGLLCERAMKEREEEVKCEYEKVLGERLIEQYESYLKFNNDQLFRRCGETAASYVS